MSTHLLPRLFTAREVASSTGLPLASIYDMTRRGLIPAVRITPRCYRYSATAIAAWIEAGGCVDCGDGV